MMYDYDLARFDEVFNHIYDTVAEKTEVCVADDHLEAILNAVLVVAYGGEFECA